MSSLSTGRRAAPRPPSRQDTWRARIVAVGVTRAPLVAGAGILLAGAAALLGAVLGLGPDWLGGVGAVAVSSAYACGLAARTGGRPVIFGLLAVAMGSAVLMLDLDFLRTGAAVLTCAVSAVFGVMATVPAVRFIHAARETVLALGIAGLGALATIGFAPVLELGRFEYTSLALALGGVFGVVYRLGAGLHGLGRRGIVAVLVGAALLAGTLAYTEMLRRYGTPGLVESAFDGVRWMRANLGAFPRPLLGLLGVPALTWGCHMRARRRQGWWVCAFGVAATVSVSNLLVNPEAPLLEAGLTVLYSLVVGLVVGYVVIHVDLLLTGPPGSRARRAEEASAVRPEPRRLEPLM